MRTRKRTEFPTQTKTPDAILCADLHLREDQPVCRADDYWEAQWKKVRWLKKLALKHDCPVICAGDIFHHWKPSPYLIRMAIEFLPKMQVVAGQHDLPQHNLSLVQKSGLGVLMEAGKVSLLQSGTQSQLWPHKTGFSFGEELCAAARKKTAEDKHVAVIHHLVYVGSKPWPDAPPEGNYTKVMGKLKGYDLIVSGDNHEPFTAREGSQLLVNPGSMMRMTADQANHSPRVYLWYAEDRKVEPEFFPTKEGVVGREHIENREQRNERMEAFISRLKTEYELSLSFRENMKRAIARNKVPNDVRKIIEEVME